MNRSMVVLFGAGLALFAGVLLLKIPATRNVLTVLLAVFAFALCGIWYTAPMQLLLQPAALGLLLAIVAVLIDGSVQTPTPIRRGPAAQSQRLSSLLHAALCRADRIGRSHRRPARARGQARFVRSRSTAFRVLRPAAVRLRN